MFLSRSRKKWLLDQAVRLTRIPATRLVVLNRVESEQETPVLGTHFGGRPYFEAGESWPTWGPESRPYDVVCQIDITKCPVHPEVPFSLMTVFFSWAAYEAGDVGAECIIKTYDRPSADRAVHIPRPPAAEGTDYRIHPCQVALKEDHTYPQTFEGSQEVRSLAETFRSPQRAYEASLRRVSGNGFYSRVGGHPWIVQSDAILFETTFLGMVDYEVPANNCIADASPIILVLDPSDPMVVLGDAFQSF